jgi:TetR/AcrR family transcriptional regulator, repressor for uid operon
MERKGRNTKQRIIEESMRLFSSQGYDAVSIRSIAEAVGVGNSALYKHFRSKKEILNEITAFSIAYFQEMGRKQMMQIRSLSDLQATCITMFSFQTKDEWMVMFRKLLLVEQFRNPEMQDIYRRFFIELPIQSQMVLFENLMEQGIMRKGNARVMAMELYAPFYLYHLASDSQAGLEDLFREHVTTFWETNIIQGDTLS